MGEGMEKQGELVQGTLDMLVLKALARGSKHGYGVAEWIHESSNDVLRVEEGALYPALHRLELRGLLSAEWGVSDNNRRAKFYGLTAAGKKQPMQEPEYGRRISGPIARDSARHAAQEFRFLHELLLAGGGQCIKFRPPII